MDRILATRLGVHAVELIRSGETGVMAGISRNELCTTPLQDTWMQRKQLSQELIDIQTKLFNPVKKERHKAVQ